MSLKRSPMKRSAWPKRSVQKNSERFIQGLEVVNVATDVAQKAKKPQIAALLRKPVQIDTSNFNPLVKVDAYRDKALLDMARGRPCLMGVNSVCNRNEETTVAAHSNWAVHGKGGHRKADDCFSVWACSGCHMWLDQGGAPVEHKKSMFELAHKSQINWWKRISTDAAEPKRFRTAAASALSALKKHPYAKL